MQDLGAFKHLVGGWDESMQVEWIRYGNIPLKYWTVRFGFFVGRMDSYNFVNRVCLVVIRDHPIQATKQNLVSCYINNQMDNLYHPIKDEPIYL